MKIDPPLFSQIQAAQRSAPSSQARLAFEAMLTANSARNRVSTQPSDPSLAPQATATLAEKSAAKPSQIAHWERPGRVLDIKV
jgi:hypothetical protein